MCVRLFVCWFPGSHTLDLKFSLNGLRLSQLELADPEGAPNRLEVGSFQDRTDPTGAVHIASVGAVPCQSRLRDELSNDEGGGVSRHCLKDGLCSIRCSTQAVASEPTVTFGSLQLTTVRPSAFLILFSEK